MGQPAARVGDMHVCPMFDGPKPHVGGPVLPAGVPTVLIGGMPAATVGTLCACASAPDVIVRGSFTVLIGGRPAARMFDNTAHGGMITTGCPTVLIGDMGMGSMSAVSGSFPITVEKQSWLNITDWWNLITSTPPDISYGNIVIKPSSSNPDYQAQVLRDLIAINNTASGHKLLQSLNDSGKTITVENYENVAEPNATAKPTNVRDAIRKSDGTPGKGSDAIIAYNPTISSLAPDEPWQTAPPPIWLSHELIHADHFTHGTRSVNYDQNDGLSNPDGTPSLMQVEELNTAGIPPHTGSGKVTNEDSGVTENDIRQEWTSNLPQRPHY